jgi:predicted amidohydrolase
MIIGLASPSVASSLDDGLSKVDRLLSEASSEGAEIVCFPEAYLPGLRGQSHAPGWAVARCPRGGAGVVHASRHWTVPSGVTSVGKPYRVR